MQNKRCLPPSIFDILMDAKEGVGTCLFLPNFCKKHGDVKER
jgi:hypothetical protein